MQLRFDWNKASLVYELHNLRLGVVDPAKRQPIRWLSRHSQTPFHYAKARNQMPANLRRFWTTPRGLAAFGRNPLRNNAQPSTCRLADTKLRARSGSSPSHLPIICAQSGNKNQMARMKLKFKRAKIYMYDAVCQLM